MCEFRQCVIDVYIKVVVPANGLKLNHNDFVALHSIGKFSEGLKCLISSGILHTCLNSTDTDCL